MVVDQFADSLETLVAALAGGGVAGLTLLQQLHEANDANARADTVFGYEYKSATTTGLTRVVLSRRGKDKFFLNVCDLMQTKLRGLQVSDWMEWNM